MSGPRAATAIEGGGIVDVFISWTRRRGAPREWALAIQEVLGRQRLPGAHRPLEVFLDVEPARGLADGARRTQEALQRAPVLLAIVGPGYFDSEQCRWEWEAHAHPSCGQAEGDEDAGCGWRARCAVNLAPAPGGALRGPDGEEGAASRAVARWREEIAEARVAELVGRGSQRPALALEDASARAQLEEMARGLAERIADARAGTARGADWRVPPSSPSFVGREAPLRSMRRALRGEGSSGRIAVAHGPAGIGTTQLAAEYARAFAGDYPGGVRLIPAAGHVELRKAFAALAAAPEFAGFDADGGATATGRRIIGRLAERARGGERCLVVLDDVDCPAPPPRAPGPGAGGRPAPRSRARGDGARGIELGGLTRDQSLELLRAWQPLDAAGRAAFPSEEDAQAARELAELLGGCPIALELIAAHGGDAAGLGARGLADSLTELRRHPLFDGERDREAPPGAVLGAVLDTAAAALPPAALTALALAARCDPELVPWAWVEEAVVAAHPALVGDASDPGGMSWPRLAALLRSRRLLAGDPRAPTARIHRLIAARARELAEAETVEAAWRRVLRAAIERIGDEEPAASWEPAAVAGALAACPDEAFAALLDGVGDTIFWAALHERLRSGVTALIERWIAHLGRAREHAPDDLVVRRALAMALGDLADRVEGFDPRRAAELREDLVAVHRRLAEARRGTPAEQREYAVALGDLARSIRASDPARATGLLEEAVTLHARAGAAPEDLVMQREYAVALSVLAGTIKDRDRARAAELLETASPLHRRVAAAHPDHVGLQREHATVLSQLARAIRGRDPRRARELFEEAAAIHRRLADADPDRLTLQREHAIALGELAEAAEGRDPRRAAALLEAALAIHRQLADEDPDDAELQREHAIALRRLAWAVLEAAPGRALRLLEAAVAIHRRLADAGADPGRRSEGERRRRRRDLAIACSALGGALLEEDPRRAVELLEEAVAMHRPLAEADPGDLALQREHAIALVSLGRALLAVDPARAELARATRARDPLHATVLMKEATALHRDLADADPEHPSRQREHALALRALARELEDDEPDRAAALLEEAIAVHRRLADADPERVAARRELGDALAALAALLVDDEPAHAAELLEERLVLHAELAEAHPDDLELKGAYAVVLSDLGSVIQDDDPDRALELLEASLALHRRLGTGPDDPVLYRELAITLLWLAIGLDVADSARATTLLEESVGIYRHLAVAEPDSEQAKEELATALGYLADAPAAADESGLRALEEALTITRGLVAAHPDDPGAQRRLAVAATGLADAVREHEPGRAAELLEESLDIHRRLAEADPGDVELQRHCAMSAGSLASVLLERDPRRAIELLETSVRIHRAAGDADSGDLEPDHQHALALVSLARCLEDDEPDRAVALLEEGVAIYDGILGRAKPGETAELMRGRAVALSLLANAVEARDPAQAVELLEDAADMLRALASRTSDPEPLLDYAGALCSLGGIARRSDPEHAMACFEEAEDALREVAEARAGDLRLQRQRAIVLRGLARELLPLDGREAARLLEEALDIHRRLADAEPDSPGAREELAIVQRDVDLVRGALGAAGEIGPG